MIKRLQGFVIGVLVCALTASGVTFASPTNRTLQAMFRNIKIVVDGSEIRPIDAAGNVIEPFIVNGTTYLPVRAVADAVGKEVYWDGPNFTVYLGNMDGVLEHPSLRLEQATNVFGRGSFSRASTNQLTDNFNNRYGAAMGGASNPLGGDSGFQALLNMRFSHFKGTAYVRHGETNNAKSSFRIIADGNLIYSSPEITKTSPPIPINVNITGYNEFAIYITGGLTVFFGDCGFYQ